MHSHQVVVIGAGPIGAVAARSAAEAGADVLLIDRRADSRGASLCTGLVSPRTLPALGITEMSVLRRIHAVEGHAPDGRRLTVRAASTKAVVLDRTRLEEELRTRAGEVGVEIRLGCDAVDVHDGGVTVRSSGGRETIEMSVAIVAAGLDDALARAASLPRPLRLFRAAQAVVDREAADPDTVGVYFGREVAPCFFGWAVPSEPGRIRVGVAVPPKADPASYLDRLLARHFAGDVVLSCSFGRIPIGPIPHPVSDGLLLVGDAAGHVKPLSGGGLYTGAIGARIAGRTAAMAAATGRTRRHDLDSYSVACDRAIGGELRFGLAARDLLESLPDEGIADVFDALDQPRLLDALGEVGDIDRLRHLPRDLAARRSLWKRFLPLLTLLDRHLAVRGSDERVAGTCGGIL